MEFFSVTTEHNEDYLVLCRGKQHRHLQRYIIILMYKYWQGRDL